MVKIELLWQLALNFRHIVYDTLDQPLILPLRYRTIDYKKFQAETHSYKKSQSNFFSKKGHFSFIGHNLFAPPIFIKNLLKGVHVASE